MQYSHPFRIDKLGHTASVSEEGHIEQLIEQVLFTTQGERVNRPTFGSGLNQMVFAPNSDEMANATQFLVQGALQQWLGDLIQVSSVDVKNVDSTLHVTVQYTIRKNQKQQIAKFSKVI